MSSNYFKAFDGDGQLVAIEFFDNDDATSTTAAFERATAKGRVCVWAMPLYAGPWDNADITYHRALPEISADIESLSAIENPTPNQRVALENRRSEWVARIEALPRAPEVRYAA